MTRRWWHRFFLFFPPLALACGTTEVSAPQPTPVTLHSCSVRSCMTCYVYDTSVECIKG